MAEIQRRPAVEEPYALLADDRRRRTLRAVAEAAETTRRELARTLAEGDDEGATDRVELSLYHRHLPKLTRAGAVRYEPDSETVAITDRGRRLVEFLDAVERASR